MTEKQRELVLELCFNLSLACGRFKQVQKEQLFGEDLTITQFEALKFLHKAGPMQLNDISKEVLVTTANMTLLIDKLEKAGFVRRVYSKNDRRVILAELTKSGEAKVVSILPTYSIKLAALISHLDVSERKQLTHLLEKLIV